MEKRSVGVTVYSIFIIALSLGYFITFRQSTFSERTNLITSLINCFYIVCGVGLLMLKEWARKSMLIISCFFTLVGFVFLYFFRSYVLLVLGSILVLLIQLIGIYLLTRPKVKEQFK